MPLSQDYAYNWAHLCTLPINTPVLVFPRPHRSDLQYHGVIVGYDMYHTKYLVARLRWNGEISDMGDYIFPSEVLENVWQLLLSAGR